MKRGLLKFVRLGAAALALVMTCSLPVSAVGSNYGETIGGTKTTAFDKYLVMDAGAEVPNAAFTYAVTAGEAKEYSVEGKKFQVLAGVDANKVTMAGVDSANANTIAFAAGDATKQDDNASVKNYDKTVQKYAQKSGILDFSAVTFTEPGVYRYILTESGTNQGVTNDADATRVIDVYVEDASTADGKALSIAGYVLHSNENDSPEIGMGDNMGSTGSYENTKSQGFTNAYSTFNLTFRKEVAGNQASRDKYFVFTVKLSGAVPGTKYAVDLSNADTTILENDATNIKTAVGNEVDQNVMSQLASEGGGLTNVSEIIVGEDGTATALFFLQHGQEITVKGLAVGTAYDVTENAEDYKSEAAAIEGYKDAAKGTMGADVKTSYLNTRNGVIPTGVAMEVFPFVAAAGIGMTGVALIVSKRRRDSED